MWVSVYIQHPCLLSTYKPQWHQMRRRIMLLARRKGYADIELLPGRGWVHFDGKRFRADNAGIGLTFESYKELCEVVQRLKSIRGVTLSVFIGKVGALLDSSKQSSIDEDLVGRV